MDANVKDGHFFGNFFAKLNKYSHFVKNLTSWYLGYGGLVFQSISRRRGRFSGKPNLHNRRRVVGIHLQRGATITI